MRNRSLALLPLLLALVIAGYVAALFLASSSCVFT